MARALQARALPVRAITARLVGVPAAVDPLAALSDEFAGDALDEAWTEYAGGGAYDVSEVMGGAYTFASDDGGTTIPGALWFGGFQGLLTYKEVTGDFVCVCRVHVTNAAQDDRPPVAGFRQAGLGAHDPDRATVLNYVDVSIGSSDEAFHTAEWKTTVDGNMGSGTTFDYIEWNEGSNELVAWLRLTRVGSTFTMDVSSDGVAWTELQEVERADLPETLQVGPIIYSNQNVADVVGSFEFVRFSTP